jgi:uncharacterized protein YdhG (YjbR/CyaY superfamily)
MAIRSPLVDAYHARLSPAERKALEQIRAAVHAACPGAEECLSYGMPAVKFEGKPLVGWRAAAKHGAFHPLSGATVATCQEALADYDTSKGTIRFPFDGVLPAKLVKLLVATRIRENRQENRQEGEKAKQAGKSPVTTAGKATIAKKPPLKKNVARKKNGVKKTTAERS